jgi:phosphatidylglycerol:prolipoprotein diacylglycerol transferase
MYPVLFRIGHFPVSTYGLLLAVAVFVALSLFARALRNAGEDPDEAWSVGTWVLLGGIVGAKLYYVLLHQDPAALFSRAGLVWYGGLIGGAAAAALAIRWKELPFLPTLDALAPAAAVGHAIGHIGCFFSGDSYGLPSTLPWAVAFPRGMPPSTAGNLRTEFGVDIPAGIPDSALLTVHPTMLYSTLVLGAVAALLWWILRRGPRPGLVFGLYLVLAGLERFFMEFLRAKDDRFLAGFTTAQAIALLLIVGGSILLATRPRRAEERGRPRGLATSPSGSSVTGTGGA